MPCAATCSEATLLSSARRRLAREPSSLHAKQFVDMDGGAQSIATAQKSVGYAVPVGRRSRRTSELALDQHGRGFKLNVGAYRVEARAGRSVSQASLRKLEANLLANFKCHYEEHSSILGVWVYLSVRHESFSGRAER